MYWRQVLSQSPVAESEMRAAKSPESAYRQRLRDLNRILREGGSLSGLERNCVFLNTRSSRFATVSAVSGLDFDDDARALGVTDWDHDGDLDVWVTNRTAPMVRFLRNDAGAPAAHRFLALRLVGDGRTCNRDAVGARVEVVPKGAAGQKHPPLIKTVRAGEGYLGQCSKWVHVGLGEAAGVERVVVRWPSGKAETFDGLAADRHYVLRQGGGASAWEPARPAGPVKPAPVPAPAAGGDAAAVLLTNRLPAPPLPYRTFGGEAARVSAGADAPVLVNLWATWCAPCLAELQSFTRSEREIRAAGIDVVALSVDGIAGADADAPAAGPQDARRMLEELKFPFRQGSADGRVLERLQTLYDLPFAMHRAMPVPTSFLLDRAGRVAAIYRGPVEVKRLLEDAGKLSLEGEALRRASLPFPGRWHTPPAAPPVLRVAVDLLTKGELDDALHYVAANRSTLERDREFPKLLVWLGDDLFKRGDARAGVGHYTDALRLDPSHLPAMNNLAWQLATHRDAAVRNGAEAVRWAEKAADATRREDAGILDTLAAAYAEAGRFDDAASTAERAAALARAAGEKGLESQALANLQRYRQRLKFAPPPANARP